MKAEKLKAESYWLFERCVIGFTTVCLGADS
jgi:hypothetical protein